MAASGQRPIGRNSQRNIANGGKPIAGKFVRARGNTGKPIASESARGRASIRPRNEQGPKNAAILARRAQGQGNDLAVPVLAG